MTSDKLEATAPPEQSTADPQARRVRMLLWVLGLCLWVLAVFGTYATWRARQAAAERRAGQDSGSTAATPGDTGTTPIVLNPSDDAEPPARIWDPAGVQDFTFTERSGRTVTKEDLLGKPWAVAFIFSRCAGPCMKIVGQMRNIQQGTAGHDVRLVCITVDPDFDTPAQLKKLADAFGADPERWLFLTGDKDKTYRLIRDSFLLPVEEITGPDRKPGWEVLHSNYILHVNAEGVVVDKYVGTDDADVARLRRALIEEAKSLAGGDTQATDASSSESDAP